MKNKISQVVKFINTYSQNATMNTAMTNINKFIKNYYYFVFYQLSFFKFLIVLIFPLFLDPLFRNRNGGRFDLLTFFDSGLQGSRELVGIKNIIICLGISLLLLCPFIIKRRVRDLMPDKHSTKLKIRLLILVVFYFLLYQVTTFYDMDEVNHANREHAERMMGN